MCLTIPKKVVAIDDELVTVELFDGTRQNVKTMVKLSVGDFCITQQNMAVEKISKKNAEKVLLMLNTIKEEYK